MAKEKKQSQTSAYAPAADPMLGKDDVPPSRVSAADPISDYYKAPTAAIARQGWEYCVHSCPPDTRPEAIAAELQHLGAAGWELVATQQVWQGSPKVAWVFKRKA